MIKSLEGVIIDSQRTQRKQVTFDDATGFIKDSGPLGIPKENLDYYFNDDCVVFAGMGDIHIHAREDTTKRQNYKEDYNTASLAALNGGLTHCMDMPNNPAPPIDDASYSAKFALVKKGLIPFFIYAGIGPGTRPLSFKVPYKVYMGPSVGSLFFTGQKQLRETLQYYRGQSVSFHCEDPDVLKDCRGEKTHLAKRPLRAEVTATKTALELIEEFNLKGKLCHFSSGEGLKHLLKAREKGIDVQCEVTPQHLYFHDEMIQDFPEERQMLFQMNPPIRPEKDKNAMLKALIDGHIDFLATDHAPHTLEEKAKGMSGLTGLDTYGAFVSWAMENERVSEQKMAEVCSENPGRFVNRFLPTFAKLQGKDESFFGKGFGFVEKGYIASFSVLNLKKPFLCERSKLKTKVKWSPFEGQTFPGSVEAVFIRGKQIQ